MLDLFAGAGGAAMGIHQALPDAEIVGIDNRPQPRYPFTFVQADAMTYPLDGFDFVWASPPCQAFSQLRTMPNYGEWPDLLTPTRERLLRWGGPSVIENVPGAPMGDYVILCGSGFGLGLPAKNAVLLRHRLFEVRPHAPLFVPPCAHAGRDVIGVYGHPGGNSRRDGRPRYCMAEWRAAMQIDWMNRGELAQAIPPAYSKYLLSAWRTFAEPPP